MCALRWRRHGDETIRRHTRLPVDGRGRTQARAGGVGAVDSRERVEADGLRPVVGEKRYFVVTRWDTREHYEAWSAARPAGNHADDEQRGMSAELLGFEVVQRDA